MTGPACPECAADLAGTNALAVTGVGCVVVCVFCRAISVSALRRPTDAEHDRLLGDPRVTMLTRVVAAYHQRHGAPQPPQEAR